MAGVLLTVAYDGTAFHGWAAQKSVRTVEETLRGAILAVDGGASSPRGSSRTDAGVHAQGQMAAFDATLNLPPRGWALAINQHLPDDVGVRAARFVPEGYNPRFASHGKRYRYRLLLDRVRDPLERGRAWRIDPACNVEAMSREAQAFLGTHDFAAFRAAGDQRDITVRTITRAEIRRESDDPRVVAFVVEGSAFLYNMVRIAVGTLVEVGLGRRPEGTVALALSDLQRKSAGTTAPAHGLVLEQVFLTLPDAAHWPE